MESLAILVVVGALISAADAIAASNFVTLRLGHPHSPSPLNVHYLQEGTHNVMRPSVLLMHGARFSASDWDRVGVMRVMSKMGVHCIAPDAPGWGKTLGPKLEAEVDKMHLISSLLNHFNIERVVLVAASMGGSFALPFLMDSPARVAAYVPVAAVGIEEHAEALKDRKDIGMPLLAMWGENDRPYGTRAQLYQWIFPRHRMEVFPGAGHACWNEQPDKFIRLLADFYKELEPEFDAYYESTEKHAEI